PGLTVMEGLVLAVFEPSVLSVAVTVALPAVLRVRLKVPLPARSAALPGKVAFVSEQVRAAVSVTFVRRFQLASTALTVTLKAAPAVCGETDPTLPTGVPGAAVSPGASNCSLANAPGLTVIEGLVLAGLVPSPESVAVIVQLPAVLLVKLKDLTPDTKAVLAGKVSLGSVELMPTVSV